MPATPEAWAARAGRALGARPDAVGRRRGPHRRARRGCATASWSTWAEAARRSVAQPRPGPRAAADRPEATALSRRSRELSDPAERPKPGDGSPAAAALVRRLAGDRRRGPAALPGDGLRLPVRPDPQALLDRVPGPRRHAGSQLLRPARLRGPPRQLPRDRQGRRRPGPLVPARPRADARRSWLRPDLVVRVDVRVPDAGPRHARSRRAACSTTRTGWSWPAR